MNFLLDVTLKQNDQSLSVNVTDTEYKELFATGKLAGLEISKFRQVFEEEDDRVELIYILNDNFGILWQIEI
jgi:hypothetical protein